MPQTEESISRDCAETGRFIDLAATITAAFVSHNAVPVTGLPDLIASVHGAIVGLTRPVAAAVPVVARKTDAEIAASITHERLISFEDGKPYKTLRRHLTLRGLSPEAYRAKHGLPVDYPMTSAAYSAQRSELAHQLGLGQQRRKSAAPIQAVA